MRYLIIPAIAIIIIIVLIVWEVMAEFSQETRKPG